MWSFTTDLVYIIRGTVLWVCLHPSCPEQQRAFKGTSTLAWERCAESIASCYGYTGCHMSALKSARSQIDPERIYVGYELFCTSKSCGHQLISWWRIGVPSPAARTEIVQSQQCWPESFFLTILSYSETGHELLWCTGATATSALVLQPV